MVEQALRKLAPIDPTLLGDPAAAEEIHLEVLAAAGTLADLGPEGVETSDLTL